MTVRPIELHFSAAARVRFHCEPGTICTVLREFFINGEGHYRLQDTVTDEIFTSPDVFWVPFGPGR